MAVSVGENGAYQARISAEKRFVSIYGKNEWEICPKPVAETVAKPDKAWYDDEKHRYPLARGRECPRPCITAGSPGGAPGRKEMIRMKKARKWIALLAVLMLLSMLLAACGSRKCSLCGKSFRGDGHNTSMGILCDDCYNSSALGTVSARSNTGVWIAITVMVFVAVFAATSGVVYLVLQKLLPPEEPKSHGPRNGGAGQRPRPYGGEWVCPRDHSRNSGPYCTLCGAPRPQPPKAGSAGAQRPAQPVRPQQPQSPAAYPQAQRPVPPAPQPTAAAPRQTPQFDFDAAEQNTVSQPEPPPAYTGKFAKKASPAPAEQPAQEPEYDAELLAAIFREAEQGDGQQ